jgi:hypothetical protein
MLRIHSAHILLISTWLIAACSDGPAGPAAQECDAATTTVAPTVTTSAQSVVFNWNPGCGMVLLLVEENGSDRWAINAPESSWGSQTTANIIRPPVSYGQVPAGTVAADLPLPLVAGTTYELVLWRILPPGHSGAGCIMKWDSACLTAVKEFTR